jgi:hypothetical protein
MSEPLALSVVVAVRDGESSLGRVLAAIRASSLSPQSYELIVVDDASGDRTAAMAARYADTVIKLSGPGCGPSYARNRGFELATGEFVAFIEADVVIHSETLEQMLAIFSERADVGAISASHAEPLGGANFVSRYWGALLRFGEERHPGNRAQLVPGCGMIRRQVFAASGMYDEWRFASAGLESAELGERIRASGNGILLTSDLKVAHTKRWDVISVCNEVWRRSRILARSLGYVRMSAAVPSEVVFTLTRTLTPAIALAGTLSLAAAFLPPAHTLARGAIVLAVLVLSNFSVHRFYARAFGVRFAIAAVPLHVFTQMVAAIALCVGWLLREVLGDPAPDATTQAYAEVGLEIWPPVRRRV